MDTYLLIGATTAATVLIARAVGGYALKIQLRRHFLNTIGDAALYGVLWPIMLAGTIYKHISSGGVVVGDAIVFYPGDWRHILLPFGYNCAVEADPSAGFRAFSALGLFSRV